MNKKGFLVVAVVSLLIALLAAIALPYSAIASARQGTLQAQVLVMAHPMPNAAYCQYVSQQCPYCGAKK